MYIQKSGKGVLLCRLPVARPERSKRSTAGRLIMIVVRATKLHQQTGCHSGDCFDCHRPLPARVSLRIRSTICLPTFSPQSSRQMCKVVCSVLSILSMAFYVPSYRRNLMVVLMHRRCMIQGSVSTGARTKARHSRQTLGAGIHEKKAVDFGLHSSALKYICISGAALGTIKRRRKQRDETVWFRHVDCTIMGRLRWRGARRVVGAREETWCNNEEKNYTLALVFTQPVRSGTSLGNCG